MRRDLPETVVEEEEREGKPEGTTLLQLNAKPEHCWICDAWVECEFSIDLVQIIKQEFNRDLRMSENLEVNYFVYLHFDFDDYQPDKMDDMRKVDMSQSGKFRCHRMVPQGTFHYFYSFMDECFLDHSKLSVKLHDRIKDKILFKMNSVEQRYAINIMKVNLDRIN